MRHLAIGLVAAALGLGLGAAASAQNVITQPDWAAKPNAESFAEHYPKLAMALGLSGYAIIACTVNTRGELVNCHPQTEQPISVGFGEAAVAIGREFQMKPLTLNGQPVDGGTVRIPIRFVLPDGPPPQPELPPPVSDEAAKQALRAIDANEFVDRALELYETNSQKMEALGEDRATGRAAADAYLRAAKAHREDLRKGFARAFASVFSEAELTAIADFGQVQADQGKANSAFNLVQTQIQKDYARNVVVLSHAAFCAKASCDAPADIQRVWRPADPRDTARVDIPQWSDLPGRGAVDAARPQIATLLGLSGAVRLTCKVAQKGWLSNCGVDEETPSGLGYGAAAIKLTPAYRINPVQLMAGAEGRKVTVRVGFPAPETTAALQLKPGSDKAVALARRIGAPEAIVERSQVQVELQISAYEGAPPKGSDPKVFEAALDAYRTGAKQASTRYLELSIDNMSSAYTEAQLEARLVFSETAAGKAQRARDKELGIALSNANAHVAEAIIADARSRFCTDRDCLPGARPQPSAVSAAPSTPKP